MTIIKSTFYTILLYICCYILQEFSGSFLTLYSRQRGSAACALPLCAFSHLPDLKTRTSVRLSEVAIKICMAV